MGYKAIDETTVEQAIADFDSVRTAIEAQGVEVPDGTPTAQYGAKILAIQGGVIGVGAGAHNSIYRGQYLGDAVTDAQYAAISAGSFDDLYIGDYWTMGDVNWRIAAFDYFYNAGDVAFTDHHAVLVPDTALYQAAMHTESTTERGYANCDMRANGLTQARETIHAAFPEHVLMHREYLPDAVNNGMQTNAVWVDSDMELMNWRMVFGNMLIVPPPDGTNPAYNYTLGRSQLPLFSMRPDLIGIRKSYWLTDSVSAVYYALVRDWGTPFRQNAVRTDYWVRPYFCLG